MSKDLYIKGMEKAEEETGLYHHGAPCSCHDCEKLERLAEEYAADMAADATDEAYERWRDQQVRKGAAS